MRPDGSPWAGEGLSVERCQLSAVSASAARLDRLPLALADPPPGLPGWLSATRGFVVFGDGGKFCPGVTYDPEIGLIVA